MTCSTGKREFGTERQAKRGLRALKNPLGVMHAYRCELGGEHWHLGHRSINNGPAWSDQPTPPIRGYGRPRDVFTGFIVVGAHQIVFGNLCLSCPAAPHKVDTGRQTLSELDLPDDLLMEVWEAGDTRIADTLLTATPEQLDQIRRSWASLHPTGGPT